MKPLELAHGKPDLLSLFRNSIPHFNILTKKITKKKIIFLNVIFSKIENYIFLTNIF